MSDRLIENFMRMKASLIGYEEEFGKEVAIQLVALAGVMVKNAATEGQHLTRRECEAYLADEYRAGRLKVATEEQERIGE